MLSKSSSCGDYALDLYNSYCYRPQLFKVKYNTCIEKPRFSEKYDKDTINSLSALMRSSNINPAQNENSRYFNNNNTLNQNRRYQPLLKSASQISLPQWRKFDKNVLRFKGYFKEHVTESAVENYRIRPCSILYYLEDDTIQVIESKFENSGMPQADLLKRARILNENKEELNWRDFNLGKNIMLAGKNFRICNCDKFTENFFLNNGVQLNKQEEIPQIDFSSKYSMIDYSKIKKNIADLKEFTEVGLGGGHPNKGLKQFLENDRKVLSFEITWYDEKYDKELKRYKLNYYLADGQIEDCPGLETKEEEYYTPKDLILGNYINVYNRRCHIVGCDEFTKKWYKEK